MAVPEVDREMLRQLEDMGFPIAQATRALYFSGNLSMEAAMNWLEEHENDPDINEIPFVPIEIKIESGNLSSNSEEMMMKFQDLRERARRKKEEEEKRIERETEKERIRSGKELLEAKRIVEENERKRTIEMRIAEKEEERRARERIRKRLEEDKAERRRKLGLPPEVIAVTKPGTLPVNDKKSSSAINYAAKAEQMRDCLRSLKQNHVDEDFKVKRASRTLLTYVTNVVKNPDDEKFRKIRLTNPAFKDRVGSMLGGIEFLQLCGFEKQKFHSDEFLYLPSGKVDFTLLRSAGLALNSALTNPYFGILSTRRCDF